MEQSKENRDMAKICNSCGKLIDDDNHSINDCNSQTSHRDANLCALIPDKYFCYPCRKYFRLNQALTHNHFNEPQLKCEGCKKSFTLPAFLEHKNIKMDAILFRCPVCIQKFDEEGIRDHDHCAKRLMTCIICGEQLRWDSLIDHMHKYQNDLTHGMKYLSEVDLRCMDSQCMDETDRRLMKKVLTDKIDAEKQDKEIDDMVEIQTNYLLELTKEKPKNFNNNLDELIDDLVVSDDSSDVEYFSEEDAD